MTEPIEEEYFNWLCAKVLDGSSRNYYTLLWIMHKTEFISVIDADRHRTADGIELRSDFLRETRIKSDSIWENQPCSVLEVLIAFAKRALFQTDISVKHWFEEFILNLGLEDYRIISDSDVPNIEKILYSFIWRQYDSKGHGGLFPLSHTDNDQKDVEIWYQFCEYVEDRGLV